MSKQIIIGAMAVISIAFAARFFADMSAPVITAVKAKRIADTEATIRWATNEPSTSKVYYSDTAPVVFATALTATDDTNGDCDDARGRFFRHEVMLAELMPETIYYYVVESQDDAGNSSSSPEMSFETKKAKDKDAGPDEDDKLKCKPIKVKPPKPPKPPKA